MARLPQVVIRDVGGRIGVYLPQRPTAAPTVTLRNEVSTVQGIVDGVAATQAGPSTTTTAAVARRATTVAVTSAADIVAGFDCELGPLNPGTGTEPTETVRVRSIATLTVTLARPTLYSHVNGAAFYSTLAFYDVPGASVTSEWLHGHADFQWTDRDAALRQNTIVRVAATRRQLVGYQPRIYPHAVCCEQDLFDREPKFHEWAVAELDLRPFFLLCRDEVLAELGARYHALTTLGCDLLTDATAYLALAKLFTQLNPVGGLENPYERAYARAFEAMRSIAAADEDQDLSIEPHEGPRRGLPIKRAS